MPFKMYQGMAKKSKERMEKQKIDDKHLGIVGSSGRNKKIMQKYFEVKEAQKKEDKRLNLGTERGINWHAHSAFKFKDGALQLTKDGLKSSGLTESEISKSSLGKRKEGERKKWTYEEIQKERESNPEFRSGKKFKKLKGSMGKKFRRAGNKRHKKH